MARILRSTPTSNKKATPEERREDLMNIFEERARRAQEALLYIFERARLWIAPKPIPVPVPVPEKDYD